MSFPALLLGICWVTQFLTVRSQLSDIEIIKQNCETLNSDGTKTYRACTADPQFLTVIPSMTLDVAPTENTCGTNGRVDNICSFNVAVTPKCFVCDQTNPVLTNYGPDKMVDLIGQEANKETFWSSRAWTDFLDDRTAIQTNITLKWSKMYELDRIVIDFHSFRPHMMILEKSVDDGATFSVLQYYMFQDGCNEFRASGAAATSITMSNPGAVICTDEHSDGAGEVPFYIEQDRFNLFLGADGTDYERLMTAFDTTNLLEFMRFTDLRIRILQPATDGNLNLGKPKDLLKYNVGIKNIDVVGGCFCNLHATICKMITAADGTGTTSMKCDCKHNTDGDNCEKCLKLYNNRPWQRGRYLPYPTGTANECQKCECYNHAESCTYSPTLGMGVCDNCTDNTEGTNCKTCSTGYARNSSLPLDHKEGCYDCGCETLGVGFGTICNAATGQCVCIPGVTGRACDVCVDGTYGLLLAAEQPGTCKPCVCNTAGTVAQSPICEAREGQCPCKPNIGSRDCSTCKEGYYNFPAAANPTPDCIPCGCSRGGASTQMCDQTTGACTCLPNTVGSKCTVMATGFYAPGIDALSVQPRLDAANTCALSTGLRTSQNPFSGRVFSLCDPGEVTMMQTLNDQVTVTQPASTWRYHPTLRYTLEGSTPWASALIRFTVTGSATGKVCASGTGTNFDFVATNLEPGVGVSWMSMGTVFSLSQSCVYRPSVTAVDAGTAAPPVLLVDSVVLVPELQTTNAHIYADTAGKVALLTCYDRVLDLATTAAALNSLDAGCREISYSVGAQMAQGGLPCLCDAVGSVTTDTCEGVGGQCQCKPGVSGRTCNQCEPGYYNFTSDGCTACECSALGSSNLVCDYLTGQCPCRTSVATAAQTNVLGIAGDLKCRSCLVNFYGYSAGQGCSPCNCNMVGSNNTQCADNGQCECKLTITGQKCGECEAGYYRFSTSGCSPCTCNAAGSVNPSCDQMAMCTCKKNVMGSKCNMCRTDAFNLHADNPDGCQKCFCFGHGSTCTSADGFVLGEITAASTSGWAQSDPIISGTRSHVSSPAAGSFTGNMLSSYNHYLSMQVTGVGTDPILYDPAVQHAIVLQGNGRQVYHTPTNFSATQLAQTLQVRLHHDNFHIDASTEPTEAVFYGILADLTAIHLQKYFGVRQVLISGLTMVVAKEAPAVVPAPAVAPVVATGVEKCTCTATRNTAGNSCEKCAQGNKRGAVVTSYGTCSACNCNSNGQTTPPMCDQLTGVCLNCRDGTIGDQCESCAANVITPLCIQCQDQFWGISQTGCSPCNCDTMGSTGPVCNKATGACSCKTNVGGDKCDVCQDNFYDMTLTGCKQCDDCYALVGVEVQDLRVMRDNLTARVEMLQANDDTTALGLFQDRLSSTQASMTDLKTFLRDATEVQGSVDTDITRLNTTLQESRGRLDGTAADILVTTNTSVYNAEGLVTQGQAQMEFVGTQGVVAHGELTGEVSGLTNQIQGLKDSLGAVETELSTLAGSSTGDVATIASQVEQIETKTTDASAKALQSQDLASTSIATHRQTTAAVTNLKDLLTSVQNQHTQVSATGTAMNTKASELLTNVNVQRANIESIGSVTTNHVTLQAQAQALQTEATALKANAQAATVGDGSTVARVTAAEVRTETLVAQTEGLFTAVDNDHGRVVAAETTAMAALDKEIAAFKDANNMADVMINFDAQAEAVKSAADTALDLVDAIKSSSQSAIDTSSSLRAQLQPIQTTGQAALATAQSAHTLAEDDYTQIAQLQPIADALLTKTNQQLNQADLLAISETVMSANSATMIKFANSMTKYQTNVDTVQALLAKVATAASNSTDILGKVKDRQTRVNRIETILNEFKQNGLTDLSALQAMVTTARDGFDSTALQQNIAKFIQENAALRQRLDTSKAREAELKLAIARLRAVRDQLSNSRR